MSKTVFTMRFNLTPAFTTVGELLAVTVFYEVTCLDWTVGSFQARDLDGTIQCLLASGATAEDIEIVVCQ